MTSSSDTFPFGIADVVELLGLTVRRRLPSSLYLNCPFCGDQRGRLNVNTDKNVWRCNRCGAAGGMLALYARYNCTGNADAYREICEALGRYYCHRSDQRQHHRRQRRGSTQWLFCRYQRC